MKKTPTPLPDLKTQVHSSLEAANRTVRNPLVSTPPERGFWRFLEHMVAVPPLNDTPKK